MTERIRRLGSGLLVVVAMAVAGVISPALAADDSDLAGRVLTWEKAYNAHDVGAIAALYAEDGVRLPYQAPAIHGRNAIITNIKETIDSGIVQIKLAATGSETHGTMAWGHGTYVLLDAEGNTVQSGKWMNVSEKVGGKWLIKADIWNTNAPQE